MAILWGGVGDPYFWRNHLAMYGLKSPRIFSSSCSIGKIGSCGSPDPYYDDIIGKGISIYPLMVVPCMRDLLRIFDYC